MPKAKRGKSSGKAKTKKRGESRLPAPGTPRCGRPSKASLFLSAVASKSSVHQDVVEMVLHAVEKVAVATLKEQRKFRVSFLQGKLHEKPERPATEKNVFGHVVSVPGRPDKTTVKFSATTSFRKLFE